MRFLLIAAFVLLPVSSNAQSSTSAVAVETAPCSSSFPKRLAEARAAIKQRDKYKAEYDRAVEWAQAHQCRELTPLEIAIRKLDDPRSFVCDSPKPAWMTRKFNDEHQGERDYPEWQPHATENAACSAADPVSLDLTTPPAPQRIPGDIDSKQANQLWELHALSKRVNVVCYQAPPAKTAACTKNQADIAALLASIQAEVDARDQAIQAEKAKRADAKQAVVAERKRALQAEKDKVDEQNRATDAAEAARRKASQQRLDEMNKGH